MLSLTTLMEQKITRPLHKHGYYFFMQQKLKDVTNIIFENRVHLIGQLWQQLSDEEKQPFREQAIRYNNKLDEGMKEPDWQMHRTEIVRAANICANIDPETPE